MNRRVALAPVVRQKSNPVKVSLDAGNKQNESRIRRVPGKGTPSIEGFHFSRPSQETSAAELVKKFNELPLAERKQLSEQMLLQIHLDSDQSAKTRDLDMWSVAIHAALVRVIGSGMGGVPGVMLVKKQCSPTSVWGPVNDFMHASKLAQLTVIERQAAYYMLADLLVSYARAAARKSRAPLSLKLVCNCTGQLAGVFENAFPGYLQAGYARLVVRSHQNRSSA